MQMQKSWADAVREARQAREAAHNATPPGYYSNRSPYTNPWNTMSFANSSGRNVPLYTAYKPGSDKGSQLGDFLTDLSQAITAGASAYGQVTAAETLSKTGIQPVGYSAYGTPIYQSTPPGVTPQYGSMVPSGMVLPAGVTPSYPYPVGFVQQAGVSGAYQIQPPGSFLSNTGITLPLLLIGGGLVALLAFMK